MAENLLPITIYMVEKAPFFAVENQLKIPNSSGWWNCLKVEDINNDGNLDIVAGNEGMNNQMKPSADQPVTIDAADIDNNGSLDAILSYYVQGKSYQYARDELLDRSHRSKLKISLLSGLLRCNCKRHFQKSNWKKPFILGARISLRNFYE